VNWGAFAVLQRAETFSLPRNFSCSLSSNIIVSLFCRLSHSCPSVTYLESVVGWEQSFLNSPLGTLLKD